MEPSNINNQALERETRVFVLTHSQKEVEVFTYLKAREMVNITTKETVEQTRALFNQTIVRIGDEKPADKYEYSLDELRAEDYLQIVEELTGLVQQTTGQKKNEILDQYYDLFLGKDGLPSEAIIVEVCKYMGWDYYTYMEQPSDFIETIIARMIGEGRAKEYMQNKYGSK